MGKKSVKAVIIEEPLPTFVDRVNEEVRRMKEGRRMLNKTPSSKGTRRGSSTSQTHIPGQKFPLGTLRVTPGALRALKKSGDNVADFVARHASGDWGELSPGDRRVNEIALKRGSRIMSAYRLKDEVMIFVGTEGDRSTTVVLLPSEY